MQCEFTVKDPLRKEIIEVTSQLVAKKDSLCFVFVFFMIDLIIPSTLPAEVFLSYFSEPLANRHGPRTHRQWNVHEP